MRIVIFLFIIILNFILQTTLLSSLALNNIVPDTSLILIILYARLRNDTEGFIFGFVTGLLTDIFFSPFFGFYALLGGFIGYFAGKPFRNFYRSNLVTPLLLIGFGTFIYEYIFYFFNFLFRGKVDFFSYFTSLIFPEIIYNLIFSIFIYKILFYINFKIECIEKPKRKIFEDIETLS